MGEVGDGIKKTSMISFDNAGNVLEGISLGNNRKVIEGIKNVGKVATIGVLAVGAIDMIDGPDGVDIDGSDV